MHNQNPNSLVSMTKWSKNSLDEDQKMIQHAFILPLKKTDEYFMCLFASCSRRKARQVTNRLLTPSSITTFVILSCLCVNVARLSWFSCSDYNLTGWNIEWMERSSENEHSSFAEMPLCSSHYTVVVRRHGSVRALLR